MERTHAAVVAEGLYHMGGSPCWNKERVRGRRSSTEAVMDDLLSGTRGGHEGMMTQDVEPRKKGGGEEG